MSEEILKLIETVDPEDSAAMDEIDARVWCWIEGLQFVSYGRFDFWARGHGRQWDKRITFNGNQTVYLTEKYTRSRDALKAIRPEGLYFDLSSDEKGVICKFDTGALAEYTFSSLELPTEELAELHAIIQAIQWERDND